MWKKKIGTFFKKYDFTLSEYGGKEVSISDIWISSILYIFFDTFPLDKVTAFIHKMLYFLDVLFLKISAYFVNDAAFLKESEEWKKGKISFVDFWSTCSWSTFYCTFMQIWHICIQIEIVWWQHIYKLKKLKYVCIWAFLLFFKRSLQRSCAAL